LTQDAAGGSWPADEVLLLVGRDYYEFLLDRVREARERVLVVVGSIDPEADTDLPGGARRLIDELGLAAGRGVDCRCLLATGDAEAARVSDRPDAGSKAAGRSGGTTMRRLRSKGVVVRGLDPEKGGEGATARYVIVDGAVAVGGPDWTDGTLFAGRSVALAATSVDLARRLRFEFERLWRAAEPGGGGGDA